MTQTEINQAEWQDSRNWRGGWFGFYGSPRDNRAWVPKRDPRMGFTVNLAHRAGIVALAMILLVGLAVGAVAILATR